MARLNLTLDADTENALERHARTLRRPRAAVARELLREALASREARVRRERLARDYSAGRSEAKALLEELEAAQLTTAWRTHRWS